MTARSFVVTPAAAEVCSTVGPYAWVVLEELVRRASPDDMDVCVEASVRDLAAAVRFSKDAVARALLRLIDAGVVERTVERDHGSGRFGRAVYRVHLDRAGMALAVDADTGMTPRATAAIRSPGSMPERSPRVRDTRSGTIPLGQLSLLDDDGTVA